MTISIFLKWTLLVWLNAALSFFLALNSKTEAFDILGICLAVFTFVGFYSCVDLRLLKQGKADLRTQLLWSVILKSLTQLVIFIEIFSSSPIGPLELFTGLISFSIVQIFMGIDGGFTSAYVTTIIDGIMLSLFALLLMPVVQFIHRLLKTIRNG